MSQTTIEWTQRPGTIGETWNLTTGCNKVDRGCKHCYAEVMHRRLMGMMPAKYNRPFLEGAQMHRDLLGLPGRWKKPRTVFVDSMSDLFHANVSFEFLALAFAVMDEYDQHTYLILTKRPERALAFWEYMRRHFGAAWRPKANVWVGTSVHDQASADIRVSLLAQLDVEVRFLSAEPLLGPVTLPVDANDGSGFLEWVICGGESGPGAQPMHPDWPRYLRDQCRALGTPFFFKQWGSWVPSKMYPPPVGVTLQTRWLYDADGHPTGMRRAPRKNCNLLDGEVHQAFPG